MARKARVGSGEPLTDIHVRIPEEVMVGLRAAAARDGRSVNGEIVYALTLFGLDGDGGVVSKRHYDVIERLEQLLRYARGRAGTY